MKFSFYIIVIIFLSVSLITIRSVNLKSESHAQLSTSTSIMEFLNSLYKVSNNEASESEEASESGETYESEEGKPRSSSTADYKPKKKAGTSSSGKGGAKGLLAKRKRRGPVPFVQDNELGLVKEGWLRISSRSFLNENIYPRIINPDFSPDFIDLTEGTTFRKNPLYNKWKKDDKDFPPSENSFWFRLSKRNLWYSLKKEDFEALGSIPIRTIFTAENNPSFNKKAPNSFCFFVKDSSKLKWELCAEISKDRLQWVCKIKELKGIHEEGCSLKEIESAATGDIPLTVFERKVSQPIILIPQPNRFCNDDWNYDAAGSDWECDCAEGHEQSPININTKAAIESPIVPVFTYQEVEVKITENAPDGQVKSHKYVKMKNENHLLQITADSFGTITTLDGTTYAAHKIQWHTPSEHQINGKTYPLEMQIVHRGVSDGAIAKHVVLSFLFVKKPGVYNKFLDDVDFFNLPNPLTKEKKMETDLYLPKIFYNSDDNDLPIMKPFSVFTYQGSLTSPPCTEQTIHYVASEPIEIGSTAIELFQEAVRMPDLRSSKGDIILGSDSTNNARKAQPLNGRNVYWFKIPKEEPLKVIKKKRQPPKVQGHYEKVIKKINNYYYVNNRNPSGMPGSLVVSEKEAKGVVDQ